MRRFSDRTARDQFAETSGIQRVGVIHGAAAGYQSVTVYPTEWKKEQRAH
jgi:hypothetical protein